MDFQQLDAYWRATNYLTVGQIYLQANPLLREPLRPAHIKPRLLGHWGTSPGLSFIYVHLNRLIVDSDASVIYAFHGYQRAIHELVHGRPDPERFHVRGFKEEGTTTPFDMTVRNGISRYYLCIEALRRAPRMADRAAPLIEACASMLARQDTYIREHLEDMPEVRDWTWTEA